MKTDKLGVRGKHWFLGMALAISSLAMSGCNDSSGFAMSLEPFYTPEDLQLDKGLEGSWTTEDGDVTFSFEPGNGKEYNAVVKEREGERRTSAEFEAHLMHVGSYTFLDFFPKGSIEASEFFQMHVFRAHSIVRIDLSSETLQMAFLDGTWLQKKVDDKSVDVPCQKADGMMVLTGTTEQVQEFLFMYGQDHEAFAGPITLTRPEAEP